MSSHSSPIPLIYTFYPSTVLWDQAFSWIALNPLKFSGVFPWVPNKYGCSSLRFSRGRQKSLSFANFDPFHNIILLKRSVSRVCVSLLCLLVGGYVQSSISQVVRRGISASGIIYLFISLINTYLANIYYWVLC